MRPFRFLAALGFGCYLLLCSRPDAHAGKLLPVKWLTKSAEKSILQNRFAQAAVLFQGAIALQGEQPNLLWRLAEIYTMGGQFSLAQETYQRWLKVGKNTTRQTRAKAEIARLENAPAPFVNTALMQSLRQRSYAIKAVKLSRKYQRRKKYRVAIRYLEAALTMDSTLVGTYRLLGALYGKMGMRKQEQAFYIKYLRMRPGGRLAKLVRKRITDQSKLSKISFLASFPCRVYVNRLALDVKRKTPLKNVLLPPGTYTVVLYNKKYHVARKHRIVVQAGKGQSVWFKFGILDIRLKPWARVRANGRDLGLWTPVGLPESKYTLNFESGDGTKRMTKTVRIRHGKSVVVDRWK